MVLNVRSVDMGTGDGTGNGPDPDPAADARTRLVAEAVRLIGNEGARAATVRRVAEAAGVSAPLVLHHFGSKDGLVEACDAHVFRLTETILDELVHSTSDAAVLRLFASAGMAEAMVYIGRSLQDGGELGRTWFRRLYELTRTGMDDMERNGVMRPVADPAMTALLLLSMDLGMVLLRRHAEQVLGGDLTDAHLTDRWVRAEFGLLTTALLRLDHADTDDNPETT
jgi:AcrR family transcriptional regulator